MVVGGGFIGCEVTASLTQLGVQVTHVVREGALFTALQAPPLSEALENLWKEHGVAKTDDLVPAGISESPKDLASAQT